MNNLFLYTAIILMCVSVVLWLIDLIVPWIKSKNENSHEKFISQTRQLATRLHSGCIWRVEEVNLPGGYMKVADFMSSYGTGMLVPLSTESQAKFRFAKDREFSVTEFIGEPENEKYKADPLQWVKISMHKDQDESEYLYPD